MSNEYRYVWLPASNSAEFPELELEMQERKVAAEYSDLGNAGRLYRVPIEDLSKLPVDEKGPHFGDDDSGHGLSTRDPKNVEADRQRFDGSDWVAVIQI